MARLHVISSRDSSKLIHTFVNLTTRTVSSFVFVIKSALQRTRTLHVKTKHSAESMDLAEQRGDDILGIQQNPYFCNSSHSRETIIRPLRGGQYFLHPYNSHTDIWGATFLTYPLPGNQPTSQAASHLPHIQELFLMYCVRFRFSWQFSGFIDPREETDQTLPRTTREPNYLQQTINPWQTHPHCPPLGSFVRFRFVSDYSATMFPRLELLPFLSFSRKLVTLLT